MEKECRRCLNVEVFDTLHQKPIRINSDGICNQCLDSDKYSHELINYRNKALTLLPEIFKTIKSQNHEYDALVSLSGGKDSSAALILAKNKYKLKILAYTSDKGNFYDGVKEKIIELTDFLGVEHVFVEANISLMNEVFKFGISTLSTGGIQCKLCGGLVHIPLLSKFMLDHDIPIIITGLDLWEIQEGYIMERKQNTEVLNPFLFTLPSLKKRWNNYQSTINDCMNLLKRFASESQFPILKDEFLGIVNKLIKKYGLFPDEISEFNKLEFYDIALTAIEISNKKKQLELLKKFGWTRPRDLFTGEIIGTDCKIGGLINALTTFKQKRKMWSYRIRSGLVNKKEAIEEITKEESSIHQLYETLKQLGFSELNNRLRLGWDNKVFRELYNIDLINKINTKFQ